MGTVVFWAQPTYFILLLQMLTECDLIFVSKKSPGWFFFLFNECVFENFCLLLEWAGSEMSATGGVMYDWFWPLMGFADKKENIQQCQPHGESKPSILPVKVYLLYLL